MSQAVTDLHVNNNKQDNKQQSIVTARNGRAQSKNLLNIQRSRSLLPTEEVLVLRGSHYLRLLLDLLLRVESPKLAAPRPLLRFESRGIEPSG